MNRPAISFTAPYRVYLPDEFFNVQTSNGSALVKALPLPPISIPDSSEVHGVGFEVQHDIFGFAGRTRFHVVLNTTIDLAQSNWKEEVCEQDRSFVEDAINAVNRLLAVYRDRDVNSVGVRSFHVIELVRGDLSDIELVVIDNDFNRIENFVIAWPGFRSMGFGSATDRAGEVVAAIRADLATNAGIPLERELISSARNHLWRRQLRLVPIEANTAFETFALTILARLNPQLVMHERTEFIDKLKAIESAMAAASNVGSQAFTPWFDSSVKGYAGMRNVELLRWHQECYLLRNKITHRGLNEVTLLDAKNALDSAVLAIDFLESMAISVGK